MKVECNLEFLLELNSWEEWVNRIPRELPKEKYYKEQFIWIDQKGNFLALGEDFALAEELETYPVKIYRKIRVADVVKERLKDIEDLTPKKSD